MDICPGNYNLDDARNDETVTDGGTTYARYGYCFHHATSCSPMDSNCPITCKTDTDNDNICDDVDPLVDSDGDGLHEYGDNPEDICIDPDKNHFCRFDQDCLEELLNPKTNQY